jgi:chorismate mutase
VTKTLEQLRLEIDALDTQIVALLAKRFDVASDVAELKRREGIAVRLQDRIGVVLDHVTDLAKKNGAEPEAIRAIYRTVIETTCLHEEAKIGTPAN